MFSSLDEYENSKLFWFSIPEVCYCLNSTNFKTPVLTETDADHLPGSEIINRTFVSKWRDESACVHDDPVEHMAHLYHNDVKLL